MRAWLTFRRYVLTAAASDPPGGAAARAADAPSAAGVGQDHHLPGLEGFLETAVDLAHRQGRSRDVIRIGVVGQEVEDLQAIGVGMPWQEK